MRFILETITGRKGIKNFSSLEEYVDFMTKNGDKIKNIVESDLPYDDKPVSVATPSQSNGWEQVNKAAFGDVIKKAEKGDCVLPHKSSSVFKDEAKFEPSKSSEKTDTSSEPKVDSTPVKNNNEGSEKDLPKFEYKDESKSSSETSEKSEPKEEKKEKKQVDEGLGDKIHDLGVKAKQKLGIGLSGKELEDYINEYFVYVFMIANHQVKPNHPGFEKIAKKLIKTDSKMENVHDVVMSILEDKYYMNGFPADTIEDLLKRRLAGLGIDESIIDKAYNTFVKEEKNKDDGSFNDEIAEALRIAGVQLNEAEDDILELDEYDDDDETDESEYDNVDSSLIDKIANDPKVYNQGRDENDDGQEPDAEKIINSIDYIINNYGLSGRQALKAYSEATFMDYDTVKDAWESDGSAWDGEIPEDEEQIEEGTINDEINAGYSDDFDDEIAEALRLAGVQLDEAESTLPTTVDQKTLYANKEAEKNEDLAPEYHEVDTTPFSKDASEGFKLTLEAAVKTDKVKQIYETAKSMYAKKDVKDWLSLDRRYITKLIKEGCGYERANKLLTAAKQGK